MKHINDGRLIRFYLYIEFMSTSNFNSSNYPILKYFQGSLP